MKYENNRSSGKTSARSGTSGLKMEADTYRC